MYFPGVHQDDTNALYEYFKTGVYSDWQPPIYTIWWHIFHFRSVEFVINMIVYYSGIIYISYTLEQTKRTWKNHILVIFSFYPLYFTQLIISLKDVPYTGFLLLSICALMLLEKSIGKLQRILLWILFGLSIFLAIGFKYNGVFATLPMLFYASYVRLNKLLINKINRQRFNELYLSGLSLVIAVIMSAIVLLSFNFINFSIFQAKHSYSSILVMYNDLANIECASGDEVIPDKFFTSPDKRGIMCNEFFINFRNYEPLTTVNWSGAQNPAILIYDANNISQEFYEGVQSSWIKAVISHPYDYLTYRGMFFYNILFNQWWWTPLENNVDNSSLKISLAQIAVNERQNLATFNGLFLLLGTLIALFYALCVRGNKFATIIIVSSLLQLLSLLLVLGVPAARFFLWNYLSIVLVFSIAYNTPKIKKK